MVYIKSVREHHGGHGGTIFFKKYLLHENAYVLIGRSETFLKVIHDSFLDFIFEIYTVCLCFVGHYCVCPFKYAQIPPCSYF